MFFKRVFRNSVNQIAFFSFLAITCITFFKNALELEDAEQAYYSQWLRWGYDDQPPLYTWLQYGVNQIFGVNKVSFSILRGGIFASVLMAMWHFSRKMFSNERKSEIAVLSLVLLPVFIDFTFRRLSHTSFLCFSVLVSYFVIERLIKAKTWTNYALLGLVISTGILSKYNYVFFLVALGCTMFFDAQVLKIAFNKKFILVVFLVSVFLFPHFYWLVGPDGYVLELQRSIALKTDNIEQNTNYGISGLLLFLLAVLKLTAPLLVVFGLAVALGRLRFKKPKMDWFTKLALTQLAVLVVSFVGLNVQKVEERWLLPLLLPFIVLLLRSLEFKSERKWSTYLYALFITVIVVQTLRTPIEKMLGIPSSVHFSFKPISDRLNKNYGNQAWMLPDVTYGGNIRVLNPTREIFSRDDFSLPETKRKKVNSVEVVVGKANLNGVTPSGKVVGYGMERDTLYFKR